VSVRLGEVDTLEYQRDRGLGVTVYFGHSKGSASTADLRAAGCARRWKGLCDRPLHRRGPYAGLVEPEASPRDPDLDLDYAWDVTRSARSSWRANVRPRAWCGPAHHQLEAHP